MYQITTIDHDSAFETFGNLVGLKARLIHIANELDTGGINHKCWVNIPGLVVPSMSFDEPHEDNARLRILVKKYTTGFTLEVGSGNTMRKVMDTSDGDLIAAISVFNSASVPPTVITIQTGDNSQLTVRQESLTGGLHYQINQTTSPSYYAPTEGAAGIIYIPTNYTAGMKGAIAKVSDRVDAITGDIVNTFVSR